MHHWKDTCVRMCVIQDQCLKFLIIARAMDVWLLEVAKPTYISKLRFVQKPSEIYRVVYSFKRKANLFKIVAFESCVLIIFLIVVLSFSFFNSFHWINLSFTMLFNNSFSLFWRNFKLCFFFFCTLWIFLVLTYFSQVFSRYL